MMPDAKTKKQQVFFWASGNLVARLILPKVAKPAVRRGLGIGIPKLVATFEQ